MYEEEKIFGPFTFRQFVYMTGGLGLAYVIWKEFTEYTIFGIVVVVIALALTVQANPGKVNIDNLPGYLKKRRLGLSETEYRKWIQRKIASTQAQIEIRKERGLMPDKNLEDVLKVLEEEYSIRRKI